MSSSDVAAPVAPGAFVPDVPSCGPRPFEAEAVAVARPQATKSEAVELDEYRPGPSEEEIRAACRKEFEAEYEARLRERRREDAALFEKFVVEVREANDRRFDDLARRATELAVVIAQRLVRDRIDRDPRVVERSLVEAVRMIGQGRGLTVRVHPEDAKHLRAHPGRMSELGIDDVVEDLEQQRGGCFVDDGTNGWDMTFVSQLSHLQEAIEGALTSS